MQQITWRSPSNIALVKYWGKHGNQLPNNPSISFTLNECYSETSLTVEKKDTRSSGIELQFYFDQKENIAFRLRILKFIESIKTNFKWLKDFSLTIHSTNSFPHSAGIASSASAMSSLAMCLCSMDEKLGGKKLPAEKFLQRASVLSRLGSGSACRSVYPVAAVWGKCKSVKGSGDLYAVGVEAQLHKTFKTFRDTILIASSGEKKVSSRLGHQLMDGNVYAKARYQQAHANIAKLMKAMQTGDLDTFIQITEQEALTLHALMMTSNPGYILMNSATLQMIERIRDFREATKVPVCFTLDAGPNIHLLYPKSAELKVKQFIASRLVMLCENGNKISDFAGKGPRLIK